MKIFIATMPFTGHINPMQPIAQELVKRGHEVLWLTGREFQTKVDMTGAQFYPTTALADFDVSPLEPDAGTSGLSAAVSILRKLFIDRVPAQIRDYQAILRQFPAD